MQQITLRIREDTLEALEEEAEERGVSRSEHIRDILDSRDDVEDLQTEVERLRREKRQILEQREEATELVRYVEDELERRERRDTAPVWTRARWWLLGREE